LSPLRNLSALETKINKRKYIMPLSCLGLNLLYYNNKIHIFPTTPFLKFQQKITRDKEPSTLFFHKHNKNGPTPRSSSPPI
jgi:hypothetical protein